MERLSHMVDMALTKDDKEKNMPFLACAEVEQPIYPYGLSICLTQSELDKLDVDYGDWQVGDLFHLMAMAKITSISKNSTTDGESCRVEMQIVSLSGENEDLEGMESEEEESKGLGYSYRR
jgi:hypothetical protein